MGESPIGRIDADGQLVFCSEQASPISLVPSNVHLLAQTGLHALCGRIDRRYRQLLSTRQDRSGARFEVNMYHGSYERTVTRFMAGQAVGAIRQFRSHLAPAPLRVLDRSLMTGIHFKKVIESVFSRHVGSRWIQAITAYPAMLRWWFLQWHDDGVAAVYSDECYDFGRVSNTEVEVAIDQGMPLVPALAKGFGISTTQVRRFAGVNPQLFRGVPSPSELHLLLHLPPHLRPSRRKDYQAAVMLGSYLDHGLPEIIAQMKAGYQTRLFQGVRSPLSNEPRLEDLSTLHDATVNLSRVEREFLAGLPLGRLVDYNRDWHRAHRQASLEAAAAVSGHEDHLGMDWPGVLPEGRLVLGDVVAVELTNPLELFEEGHRLTHCVAGYSSMCFQGRCRIISLRTCAGDSLSTLEIQQKSRAGEPARLQITQHRSNHNGPVAAVEAAVARRLMRHLRKHGNHAWPTIHPPESLMQVQSHLLQEALDAFTDRWFTDRGFIP